LSFALETFLAVLVNSPENVINESRQKAPIEPWRWAWILLRQGVPPRE
jgi:hypothetical protein